MPKMSLLRSIQEQYKKKEEERQARTRTKERPEVKPDLSAFERDPSAGRQAPAPREKTREVPTPELKRAGARKTAQAVGGVDLPGGSAEKFAHIAQSGMVDTISDEEAARIAGQEDFDRYDVRTTVGARPEPKEKSKELAVIEKLPATINKKLAKEGLLKPDWHMVKHLPGYMMSAVRAIGRAVFAPFTETPIEKIQVVAHLGKGPNSSKELNAVLQWLHKHARRDTEAELFFEDVIPDYDAKIIVYKASGYTFMAVKDFAGDYIYAWPTSDEKELTNQHWEEEGDEDEDQELLARWS